MPIFTLSTVLPQLVVTEVSELGVKPNEYYMFTQELNANESKLGVPVAVFTLTNIIYTKETMLLFISTIMARILTTDIHLPCNRHTR